MNSSLIGKIQKAKRYEQEPERVSLTSLRADFRGEHDTYHLSLDGEEWHCTCTFFKGWSTCSHVMAMQRILAPMLSSVEPSSVHGAEEVKPLQKVY
ncbi:MAG: hypothetical protein M1358_17875 [Chloroflexi bacterium]|nr:hypothetical protein [Chloroflexota bacterium]